MSSATRSMAVWTGYVLFLGAGLLLIPNVILSVFRIEETDEVWIRIVGLLLIGFGGTTGWPCRRSSLGCIG